MLKGIILLCPICNKHFYAQRNEFLRGRTLCSRECFHVTQLNKPTWNAGTKGVMKPNKTSFKKGESASEKTQFKKGSQINKGRIRTDMLGNKLNVGRIPWNKGLKGFMAGETNPNWKGGCTPAHIKLRTVPEYVAWRKAVFKRDNFTCQKYKIQGGSLVAHHIINFSSNPDSRYVEMNGITLSKQAHKEFHAKYGKKHNTLDQLIEFLSEG